MLARARSNGRTVTGTDVRRLPVGKQILFSTIIAVTVGLVVYRSMTKGERGGGGVLGDFAAQI